MTEEDSKKTYRLEEVREHCSGRSCWLVIHDKVYDVTKFLEEHPGGEEVLLEQGGQDGSESFEDVGHSMDARDLMAEYYIGEVAEEDRKGQVTKSSGAQPTSSTDASSSSKFPILLVTVTVAVALIAVIAFKLVS